MFNRNILFILFLITGIKLSAQYQPYNNTPIDTLVFKKGPKVLLNGEVQTVPALLDLSNNYPEANAAFKKVRIHNAFQFSFCFAGGFLLGDMMYKGVVGKPIKGEVVAVCAGLLGVGITFRCVMGKHLKKGVYLYNKGT